MWLVYISYRLIRISFPGRVSRGETSLDIQEAGNIIPFNL
jgi:hypothetical protein